MMLGHERGTLIYLNKQNGDEYHYEVSLDDEKLHALYDRDTQALKNAWRLQEPPSPVLDFTDQRYQRCRWHSMCLELVGIDEIAVKSNKDIYGELTPLRYETVEVTHKKSPDRFKIVSLEEYRDVCDNT